MKREYKTSGTDFKIERKLREGRLRWLEQAKDLSFMRAMRLVEHVRQKN